MRVALSHTAIWLFAIGMTALANVQPAATADDDRQPAVDPALRRPVEAARVWVDSSGRFQQQAALIGHDAGSVTLRRPDGIVVRVPIDRLSRRDQWYLKRLADPVPRLLGRGARAVAEMASAVRAWLGSNRASETVENTASRSQPPSIEQLIDGEELPADLIHIQISERTLKRLAQRPVFRQTAVNDTIVGTPVRGTAWTSGLVGLELSPSWETGTIDLRFQGQVQSATVGFGGPVQIHSNSVTGFSAVKRLFVTPNGIAISPARVAARTNTSIQGISTYLPRLRGRIARRIASRRAAASVPAAEVEAAQKAATQIAQQFDRDVAIQVAGMNRQLNEAIAALPIHPSLLRSRLRVASSNHYLQFTVRGRRDAPVTPAPPAPATLGSPDIAVHVHDALVNRVVRNTRLQQMILPIMSLLSTDRAQQYVSLVAARSSVNLKQSRDGQWWSIGLSEIGPESH
jgi:hypothetical protein